MDIKIKGCQVLSGEVTPSGSKNSAVHTIPCTLLFKNKVTIKNVPEITDVAKMLAIFTNLGSKHKWDKKKETIEFDNSNISFKKLTKEDVGNMKGTSLLWGALLSRFGKVDFCKLPGGCTLGIRPFEPMYKVFRDLGVVVTEKKDGVVMDATNIKNGKSREVWLTEMSPTVTTNLIMLCSTLPGKTKLVGAASEPQVQDVCKLMTKAGVKITGIGSNVLEIEGTKALSQVTHKLLSDHYEIATFLALAAATGGEIKVRNAQPELFSHINYEFSKFNVKVEYEGNTAIIKKGQKIKIKGDFRKKTNIIRAQPWPALPVDLLPIFIPLALAAPKGYMIFHNWMYESGLFWTSELTKFGAEVIMLDPHRVTVMGGRRLSGNEVNAPYIIRAVVALVMTAMIANGTSKILDADSLYRGHPKFAENLKKLGADIEVISESTRVDIA